MKTPIAIPSKGRPHGNTMKLLDGDNVAYTLFVEPQDLHLYENFANVVNIGANDRGLWFARNFILDYYKDTEVSWVWVMDDDIINFFEIVDKKCIKIPPAEVLSKLEKEYVKDYKSIVQLGLSYQQFAWSATKKYSLNKLCDCCVCINIKKLDGIRFREMPLKVDRDFSLQLLTNNKSTMLINQYAMGVPKNGSNKGGLHDVYHTEGLEKKASMNMIKLWPNICSYNLKKDGRPDVKINMNFLNPLR